MAARRSPHPDSAPFLSRADRTEEDEEKEEDEGLEEEQGEGDSGPAPLSEAETAAVTGVSGRRARLMVAVLCYVNLLNYMDRFTVAGVLPEIEAYFGIGDGSSGLLQTVFISSYMVLAPLFGFLGDRSSRRLLLCVGIALWSTVTLASSFVPRQHFWLLLLTRGLVGVGEASYSTVAPTIIADLFVGDRRSRMLGLFYFAIPVGSGLGYIAGSKVKDVMHDWHWALRVTPALGVVAVVLLLLVMKEPPRGAVERHGPPSPLHYTSWCDDVRALARNRSFVLSSLGFTAVAFVTGALALWAPAFLQRARLAAGAPPADDSLVFGAVTCVTGVLGVGAGVELSRRLRLRSSRADPLVCAIGLLGAAPCLFLAVALARASIPVTYVFIFIGETLLSLNWALVADILLYVVVPTRRSTAEALQIVMSHLLGDAGSPYLVGVMSDAVRRHRPPTPLWAFRSLGYALTLCAFVGALGGGLFLATALVLPADRRRAHLQAQGLLAEAGGNPGAVSERIVVPRGGRAAQLPVSSVLI